MSCGRCGRIMYPHGSSRRKQFNPENHRKSVCSDGFPSCLKEFKYENGEEEILKDVPWPQPQGIFENAKTFNSFTFLVAVRHMYERFIVADEPESLTFEYDALAQVCNDRCHIRDGTVFFRTFPQLQIIDHPAVADALVILDGIKHLRIDCLRDA